MSFVEFHVSDVSFESGVDDAHFNSAQDGILISFLQSVFQECHNRANSTPRY